MDIETLRQTLTALLRKLRREAMDRGRALQSRAGPTYDRLRDRARHAWATARGRAGPALAKSQAAALRGLASLRAQLPQLPAGLRPAREPPAGVRRLAESWHKGECWLAVAAFGFIAAILLLDVIGREFVGPVLRLVGLDPGATGIFAAQKLSVFALVIGSFAGIGIATATASHIVPRFAHGWVPAAWGPVMDRLANVLTGLFLVGVAWFGFKFVGSSFKTDLRAPVLDWPVWPVQMFIPLGFLSAAGRYFLYAVWPALKPAPPEFQE
jgi:TRAP-type C4-dicarboxylate transport system permease small subunit